MNAWLLFLRDQPLTALYTIDSKRVNRISMFLFRLTVNNMILGGFMGYSGGNVILPW